jgi:hypothetical protein
MIVLYGSITPFVPADAGTQFLLQSLGPRIRGDERSLMSRFNINRLRSNRKEKAAPTGGRSFSPIVND